MKKISLFILLISLAWLPVQVAFASSFVSSLTSELQITQQEQDKKPHCQMEQVLADCCGQDSACNQMDNGCHQSGSFIAITAEASHSIFTPHHKTQNTYNYPMIGLSSLSAYRPPRLI